MSLDSKYNNYIYISNRPSSIKILGDNGEMVTIEEAAAGLLLGSALISAFGAAPPDLSFKFIGGESLNFPPYIANGITFRELDAVIDRSYDVKNKSFKNSNKIKTSDPFINPNSSNAFEMNGQAMSFKYFKDSGKYSFDVPMIQAPGGYGYMDKATAETLNISTLFSGFIPSELDTSLKIMEPNGKFKFFQNDFASYAYNTAVPLSSLQVQIKDFFKGYADFFSLGLGRGQIVDITTRIGVPFDFQTVIDNDVDLKTFGVRNNQPKYEKIYNYYDPQYEPVVVSLIDGNLNGIDERSLPSMYDLLYFPIQQNALKSLVGVPSFILTEDNFSISNLNQYLDSYSVLYDNYLNDNFPALGTQTFVNQYFYSDSEGGGTKIVGTDDGEDQAVAPQKQANEEGSEVSESKAKIIKSINDSFGKSKNIINEKSNSVPIWIQDLKTGVYFSERSMQYFNQALEHDNAFPFFTKINIPTEGRGQITSLLSKYNLLDSLNSYIASLITPNAEIPASKRTYDSFYGGLINGLEEETKQFNLYANLNLQTFKLHFYKKPKQTPEAQANIEPVTAETPAAQINQDPVASVIVEDQPVNAVIDTPGAGNADAFNFGGYFAAQPGQTEESETSEEPTGFAAFSAQDLLDSSVITSPTGIPQPAVTTPLLGKKNVFYDSDLFIDTFKDISMSAGKNVFVYTDEPQKLVADNEGFVSLIEQIKSDLFAKELKKLLFDRGLLRSPRQIREGKLAHQETIMYEIAKYSVSDVGTETYIQSIFLPQASQDTLNYYDTQIIPYKNYFYKIFTHKVIVGTKYSITPLDDNDLVGFTSTSVFSKVLKIKYDIEPVLQFVRVPYYNTEEVNLKVDQLNYTRVEDKPPMPPESEIVPFRDINNQILILLSNGGGSMEAYPKIIFEEDRVIFDGVALSQDRVGNKPQKIIFGSDDQSGTFQVFRTTNPPSDYTDIATDETLVEYSLQEDYLFDSIIPNVTYYYTFRFVDIHGKISNPTNVYKVLMVQSPGLPPYLKVDQIDIAEAKKRKHEEKFSSTKEMTKYLLIRPSALQNAVQYPNLTYDTDGEPVGDPLTVKVKVGEESGQSVFGNKYKLRVTSKQTGKKIDINFTVKNPQDIINDL
tara:strand:+ start:427 stop:3777 length:3351 start_codon:yes stop_codon:yes gene_type:complete